MKLRILMTTFQTPTKLSIIGKRMRLQCLQCLSITSLQNLIYYLHCLLKSVGARRKRGLRKEISSGSRQSAALACSEVIMRGAALNSLQGMGGQRGHEIG